MEGVGYRRRGGVPRLAPRYGLSQVKLMRAGVEEQDQVRSSRSSRERIAGSSGLGGGGGGGGGE